MEKLPNWLIAIFFVAYFAVGIAQIVALADGIGIFFGISGFLAYVISFLIAMIPPLGAAGGAYGARAAWGWSWTWAILFMVWPYLLHALVTLVFLIGAGLAKVSGRASN
jgi:hypothetical protein